MSHQVNTKTQMAASSRLVGHDSGNIIKFFAYFCPTHL